MLAGRLGSVATWIRSSLARLGCPWPGFFVWDFRLRRELSRTIADPATKHRRARHKEFARPSGAVWRIRPKSCGGFGFWIEFPISLSRVGEG
jgi:hypothetical protein